MFGCVFEMKCFGYVIVLQATAITNTTNWKKKKKISQKLFIETHRHKRVSNKLRIAAENGALFLGARQTHSMPAAVHKQKNTNTLPFKQRDHLLFFLQRTNHFEFTQIAHMRLLVFAEFNLCHNCRLMQFQRNKLWR